MDAVDLATRILICALLIGGVWLAIQPRYAFLVHIRDGLPRVARGKLTPAQLQDIRSALQHANVARGWIGGTRHGKRVVLVFSHSIPKDCRQQLRNVWTL